jgi:predicted HTH domain antitoxin
MSGDNRYEKILTFSNEKGQVRTMCDVAQRLEDKGRSEGRIEGRIEVLVTLVKSGSITVDTAAGILKITTTEFKKYL